MTSDFLDVVHLDVAVLCESCKNITAAATDHCPVCGWKAVAILKPMLERLEKPKQ